MEEARGSVLSTMHARYGGAHVPFSEPKRLKEEGQELGVILIYTVIPGQPELLKILSKRKSTFSLMCQSYPIMHTVNM